MLEHDVNTQVGHVSGFPNFAIVAKFIHHAKMEGDKAIYSSRNIPIALSSARLLRPQRDLSQVDQLTDWRTIQHTASTRRKFAVSNALL